MHSCGASLAQAADWWAHIGVARVVFHESATLYAGGTEVPGASGTATDNTTLGVELGYRIAPAWSASIAMGIPPTTTINGSGTAAPFDRIGEAKYGPLVIAGHYRLGDLKSVRPYIGAGAVYSRILSSKDGAMQRFHVI